MTPTTLHRGIALDWLTANPEPTTWFRYPDAELAGMVIDEGLCDEDSRQELVSAFAFFRRIARLS